VKGGQGETSGVPNQIPGPVKHIAGSIPGNDGCTDPNRRGRCAPAHHSKNRAEESLLKMLRCVGPERDAILGLRA